MPLETNASHVEFSLLSLCALCHGQYVLIKIVAYSICEQKVLDEAMFIQTFQIISTERCHEAKSCWTKWNCGLFEIAFALFAEGFRTRIFYHNFSNWIINFFPLDKNINFVPVPKTNSMLNGVIACNLHSFLFKQLIHKPSESFSALVCVRRNFKWHHGGSVRWHIKGRVKISIILKISPNLSNTLPVVRF